MKTLTAVLLATLLGFCANAAHADDGTAKAKSAKAKSATTIDRTAQVPAVAAVLWGIKPAVAAIVLQDRPMIYLYHRRLLIAHTTKLEGYKQMPDGLVRVIGLKLK